MSCHHDDDDDQSYEYIYNNTYIVSKYINLISK